MSTPITYLGTKNGKGVWVILGGFDYESANILAIFKKRPGRKKVRAVSIVEGSLPYDFIHVEQHEIQK
jgi:hypothetical protein